MQRGQGGLRRTPPPLIRGGGPTSVTRRRMVASLLSGHQGAGWRLHAIGRCCLSCCPHAMPLLRGSALMVNCEIVLVGEDKQAQRGGACWSCQLPLGHEVKQLLGSFQAGLQGTRPIILLLLLLL